MWYATGRGNQLSCHRTRGFKLSNNTVLKDEKKISFVEVLFENIANQLHYSIMRAMGEFINSKGRGGLKKLSDFIYIVCVYASALNRYTFDIMEIKSSLLVIIYSWIHL